MCVETWVDSLQLAKKQALPSTDRRAATATCFFTPKRSVKADWNDTGRSRRAVMRSRPGKGSRKPINVKVSWTLLSGSETGL